MEVSVFTVILRLVLAAVFLTAGLAKVKGRREFSAALPSLGVPARLVPIIAVAVAPLEIAVGVLLLINATAFGAAIAALILIVGFSLLLVTTIRHGTTGGCNCFGALSSDKPVGPSALIRNGIIAAIAAMIVAAGPL